MTRYSTLKPISRPHTPSFPQNGWSAQKVRLRAVAKRRFGHYRRPTGNHVAHFRSHTHPLPQNGVQSINDYSLSAKCVWQTKQGDQYAVLCTAFLFYCNARFPPFRCRSSVAVSPFPLALAVSVHHCRCRCRCRMPLLVGVNDLLDSCGTTATEKKNSILFQRKNGYGSFLPFTAVTERNLLT